MASSPTELRPSFFHADDGTRLAWRETGAGRPLVLLHGLFSNATVNWIRFGHAALLAETGCRVIMPDLRAHGDSEGSHDPARYPPDILVADALALIRHLGLTEPDIGGYSLGGRTVARMLARGLRPCRAAICGMGLTGLLDTAARSDHFRRVLIGLGTFERGSPEWFAEAFLKTTGGDPAALLPLLDSFVDTPPAALAAIETPVLVACGDADADNGSAAALADLLPHAHLAIVPGNHMSAVTRPELGRTLTGWFGQYHERPEQHHL